MWKLAILPVFLVAFLVVAYLVFYRGGYTPPPTPDIAFETIDSIPVAAADFSDQPVFTASPIGGGVRGRLLVDESHRNNFNRSEIGALLSRVAARGYTTGFRDDDAETELADQLSQVDAFLVILPITAFTEAEIEAVVKFVEQGGRLLLLADPGRNFQINQLAEPFGVFFQPDYLYNLKEYDSNFREIFVRDFRADSITTGIREMVFYYAGSIESTGFGLAMTDGNTSSSISEIVEPRSPLAVGAQRNILAIYDLTFMVPPYIGVKDNDRLVSNIADFLTDSGRSYALADFPRFFQDEVDILVGDPALVTRAAGVKQVLGRKGVSARLQGAENVSRDTVFLSLFGSHDAVSRYLDAYDITVSDETFAASFASGIPREDRALLLLHRSGERDVLIILAESDEGLDSVIAGLERDTFREGLVDDITGVFDTK